MHPEVTAATTHTTAISENDPLWYKDAVIYQIHVRSFYDGNGDGVGDFQGLTEKLDYLQDLGVTAIWILPFFKSPLKDGGYDISDYTDINPAYGTLKDFKVFLREAHRRELRVITELVMNHTSDQHPWFQRARSDKPGGKWRDWYVWSDTPDKYKDARIIFQDFEASNWTFDSVAGAHYWHRFYHHQPDLNFDNPQVRRAMLEVFDFWLEMGVDGVRLDAVPYLFEREGTNCENLPETHEFLKEVRRYIDQKYQGKMLLAEANQWPEDAAAYFGGGDECHMNFHFPLMPRLYMAVEREDRFPIIDILEQTPTLPENCQWGVFLRNHDELTLEMVTDEERDYMYRAYAHDPQARVNLGIRRRLAPLLRNNRRKTELLNGLLLSMPGTPIIYYGDEIGMGDNIYLGDRDGVRTPMQWSSDRNAGFSRANPQKLFLPVIIDPEYHYALRNVEVEQNSPHSLLWWMRRVINLRKQYRAFGRGSFEALSPDNGKVLAYLRQHEDEILLIVANLSRFSQASELDLSRFRGRTPVELFGQTRFPPIGELPYFLTLGPYAFYWFRLEWREQEAPQPSQSLPTCRVKGNWESVLHGRTKATLESALGDYMRRHRWYAGKTHASQTTRLLDWFALDTPAGTAPIRLLLTQVSYEEGEPELYLIPAIFAGDEQARNILGDHPNAGILKIESAEDEGAVICEAVWEKEFWLPLLEAIVRRQAIKGHGGEIRALQTKAFRRLWNGRHDDLHPTVHGGEQSNTSAIFGHQFILKLFRRPSPGVNPDLEIGRLLTEQNAQASVPKVAGALEYHRSGGESQTVAILHEYVPSISDAWVYTLDELGRYLERAQTLPWEAEVTESGAAQVSRAALMESAAEASNASLVDLCEQSPPRFAEEMIGPYLQSAELLGRRTAELHVALASMSDDPAFAPEPFTKLYQRSIYQSMRMQARKALDLLRKRLSTLPVPAQEAAQRLIDQQAVVLDRFGEVIRRKLAARRIRCHGDYHLGQALFTGKDFVIIDFEGEPLRPISERRIKTSPLRDVAGMIRSFHYACHAALASQTPGLIVRRDAPLTPENWLRLWYTWTSAAFLKSYLAEAARGDFVPNDKEELRTLLDAYVLEKALYELVYELKNRPDWVNIPLQGVLRLLK